MGDEGPREHRYIPNKGALWLPLAGAFIGVVLWQTGTREQWTALQIAVLVAPFVVAAALLQVLFLRKVRTDADAIEISGPLMRRRLRWGEIDRLVYKGGSNITKHRHTSKIVLRGPGGKIVVNDLFRDHEALWRRIGEAVEIAGQPRLDEMIVAYENSWRPWLTVLHTEDLPETVLSIGLAIACGWAALKLPWTAFFQALAG